MIINDTNLAILRVLARADGELTVRQIAECMPDYGWVPSSRNRPTATEPTTESVRSNLSALEWNEGTRKPLAVRSGRASRSTAWAITPLGRQYIETEDARAAKEA